MARPIHSYLFMTAATENVSIQFHEAGADVVVLLDGDDEYAAIADMACPGLVDDGLDDIVNSVVVHHDLDHDLRQQ